MKLTENGQGTRLSEGQRSDHTFSTDEITHPDVHSNGDEALMRQAKASVYLNHEKIYTCMYMYMNRDGAPMQRPKARAYLHQGQICPSCEVKE